jgi:hypothetical protein
MQKACDGFFMFYLMSVQNLSAPTTRHDEDANSDNSLIKTITVNNKFKNFKLKKNMAHISHRIRAILYPDLLTEGRNLTGFQCETLSGFENNIQKINFINL